MRVAGVRDYRLGDDDVLLGHQEGDYFSDLRYRGRARDLELPVRHFDLDGTVAEGEQVAEVDHPHVAVPAHRGAVDPRLE